MPAWIQSLFRNLFRRIGVEQALDDELKSSLELLTEERMDGGLSPSEARRQALIELGGVEPLKEKVRAVRMGRFLEDFAKDLCFALRTLAKSPSFSAVAVLTLSLGIGANTAIFAIVRDFLFSPRPWPDEAQVVQVYSQDRKHPTNFRAFSYPTYSDIREQSAIKAVFSGVLAHNNAMVSAGDGETSRRTLADIVSSDYFRTLEVPLLQCLMRRIIGASSSSTAGAALRTVAADLETALPVEQKDQTFLVRPLPRLDLRRPACRCST